MQALYHFSEDPSIDRFRPHVPATNPTKPPAVWAIEFGWLERVRTTNLFRYRFDPAIFGPSEASGQWVSNEPVEAVDVDPVGDLLAAHVTAGIEVRAVPSLWPLRDLVQSDRWDFSIVRMRNAAVRP